MSLHTDILASMRENLTPEVGARPPADAALGYGRDAWCTSSVTDDWREVDPASPLGIAQTCLRALTTARDTCPDAPGRGYDVRRCLNTATTLDDLLAYESGARGELEQDDRVESVDLKLTLDRSLAVPSVRLQFRITPRDPELASFAGVFVIPETGAETLELMG